MKNIAKYLLMVLIFAAVNLYLGSRFLQQFEEFRLKNGPISIKVIDENPIGIAGQVDMDNDGEKEVILLRVYVPDKLEFLVFDPFKKSYKQVTTNRIIVPQTYFFLDAYYNNNLNECVFRYLKCIRNGLSLVEMRGSQKEEKVLRFENPSRRFYKEEGRGIYTVLVDLEYDGRKELILQIKTDYYRHPRGIVCFDLESGKLLWEYYCGTQISEFEFKDLDGDKRKEVILSTDGINNGAVMNGSSDAYSYVIVLDSKGNEIWKQVTGGWYTSARSDIADLDFDGTFEIITAVSCHQVNYENRGKIFVFDGKTGEKRARYFNPHASFSKPYACKISKTENRIYVGESMGHVWMFDEDLNLIKKVEIEAAIPVLVLNTSWSHECSEWPYIFMITRTKILAYDRSLDSKVFEYTFEKPIPFGEDLMHIKYFSDKSKRESYGIIDTYKLYLLSESNKSFALFFQNMITTGILFTFIFFILFNGIFIYLVFRFKLLLLPSSSDIPVIKTSRFFEILQGIAHQVKNPISTILWTAEKMKRGSTAAEEKISRNTYMRLSGFLLEDVKTLQEQANNMLKMIRIQRPQLRQIDLKSFFEKIINQYCNENAEKIEILLKMEEDIFICIDEELFKEAVINILDNAVEAVPEGGKLTISVGVSRSFLKRNQVLIEIEDTGPGMNGSELKKIFTPFFTNKEKGLSIGLTICKHVIEAHEGKMKIQSRKDFGTKVQLILPLKKCKTGKGVGFPAYMGSGSDKKEDEK